MKKQEERQLLKTNGSSESDEYRKLIILIVIIASVFLLFYILTNMFTKKENDSIFKNDLNASEIEYDKMIVGNMLNKSGEYYVLVMEANDQYKDTFNSYITNSKKNIYTVDLESGFNKAYIDTENSYDEDNLKFSKTTLVKVNDHKIVKHFESKDDIVEQLIKLSE